MTTRQEVQRVRAILASGRDNAHGPNGERKPDMATCGTCGRTWDDGRISSLTPAPSARCPFEYAHTARPTNRELPRINRFNACWTRLEGQSKCDGIGGAEYFRVLREFVEAGWLYSLTTPSVETVSTFIVARANALPTALEIMAGAR